MQAFKSALIAGITSYAYGSAADDCLFGDRAVYINPVDTASVVVGVATGVATRGLRDPRSGFVWGALSYVVLGLSETYEFTDIASQRRRELSQVYPSPEFLERDALRRDLSSAKIKLCTGLLREQGEDDRADRVEKITQMRLAQQGNGSNKM